jgi:signal peptidase
MTVSRLPERVAGPGLGWNAMKPLRFVRTAATWTVIAVILGLIVIAVLIPRIGGGTPYTVQTGSMRPTLPPGTLVVVRPVPIDEIGIGDVITYQLKPGRPEVVTHRVVSVGDNAGHGRVVHTKGDANNAADASWVIAKQVRGRYWYAVPYVGRVTNILTNAQRQSALLVIVIGLLGYAGLMFVQDMRDRRRSSTETPRGGT